MTDDKTTKQQQTERATAARRAEQTADAKTEQATAARRAEPAAETRTDRAEARRAKEAADAGVPQIDASPAPAIEATAVRAAVQADEDKNLPNADTVTKQVEKKAK